MNQRGFVNILVAIGIVIAGIAGYVVVQRQGQNRQAQRSPIPVIDYIAPAKASIGATISVIGFGFAPSKNSLQFGVGFAYLNNLVSPDAKTITFTLPESFDTCNPNGSVCAQLLSRPVPGQMYEVTVINANGRSNAVSIAVASEENPPPDKIPPRGSCINRCGDGICQEVVCTAVGCPCSETPQTCPGDCSEPTPGPLSRQCGGPNDTRCPAGYECVQGCGSPVRHISEPPPPYLCKPKGYAKICPICLDGKTLIETPSGLAPVKDLRVGMSIWTTDTSGHRVSGVVQKTSKVPVSPTHRMVHLVFDDGRELYVSPGHPTVDGRAVGDLVAGDLYDGASVVSVKRVPYGQSATYDVLPSGETGFYWASGVLLASTLTTNEAVPAASCEKFIAAEAVVSTPV